MCVYVYTHWVSTRRYRSETHTRVMQTRTRSREGSTASTGLLNGHRPWSATSTADSYMSMHTSTTGAASSMPAGPTVRARVRLPSVAEDTRAMPIGQAPAPAVMATQDVAENIINTAITLEVHVSSAMACGVSGKAGMPTQPNAKSKEIDVRPSQRKFVGSGSWFSRPVQGQYLWHCGCSFWSTHTSLFFESQGSAVGM